MDRLIAAAAWDEAQSLEQALLVAEHQRDNIEWEELDRWVAREGISGACYEAILARGAVPTIPPRRNARPNRVKDPPPHRVKRDAVLRRIKEEGRYVWRTASGATRQSLAENAVFRFKALVGVKLTARKFENQRVEALVKCRVLNRMASLGMPRSERIQLG